MINHSKSYTRARMRYFIGIDIPPKTKIAIQHWRDKTWVQHTELGSVPAANFHITLAFLGQVKPQLLDPLLEQLNQLNNRPFQLTVDQFNVWQRPSIAWLGFSSPVCQLDQIQLSVSRCARNAAIQLTERKYIPHITLARKCKNLTARPLIAPYFRFNVEQFCLFESVSTASGVQYPIRHQWPLNGP